MKALLSKIWTWFNGKKTIIGAICFLLSFGLHFVGGLEATIMLYLYKGETILSNFGAVAALVGLIHKWVKYKITKAKSVVAAVEKKI